MRRQIVGFRMATWPTPDNTATTITRPDLFKSYLEQQIDLLLCNHGVPVRIGPSTTPIPVHFAVANDASVTVPHDGCMQFIVEATFLMCRI